MLSPPVFLTLLVAICSYAILLGRSDERWVAWTCLFATIGTTLLLSPVARRYSSFEVGVFLVDFTTFLVFATVALRSKRFWPLWVSGFQLTTSLAHLLKALDSSMIPLAYAAAGRFWGYPILIILAIGTYRSAARHKHSPMPV